MAKSSAIVELLTRGHGRHLGLVRGGAGKRMRPLLQPGNSVRAVWRARLDEHLGYYVIEGTRLRAATVLASSHAVYGVTHLASLARLLPERDPHEDIYDMLDRTLNDFDDIGEAAIHLVKFELAMLAELGFGLDLENCAATGETTDLIYVSPKSGGAVSRQAGDPWRDRLLRLPAFLRGRRRRPERLVGPGPAGRLSAHGAVPAAPCAGAARAGPFRRPRRIYQRGDQAPGEAGAGVDSIRSGRGMMHVRGKGRTSMYAAIRQGKAKAGMAEELARRIKEGAIPIISDVEGFMAYYVVYAPDDTVTAISIFNNHAGAEESNRRGIAWIEQNLRLCSSGRPQRWPGR